VLVSSDESPRPKEPSEEPLDLPAVPVASQWTAVLCLLPTARVVRRDHLDAHGGQLCIERVAVVGTVADESLRQFLQESPRERTDDEPLLISLTTLNPDGDRKTRAV
jgi:hypothetical protein